MEGLAPVRLSLRLETGSGFFSGRNFLAAHRIDRQFIPGPRALRPKPGSLRPRPRTSRPLKSANGATSPRRKRRQPFALLEDGRNPRIKNDRQHPYQPTPPRRPDIEFVLYHKIDLILLDGSGPDAPTDSSHLTEGRSCVARQRGRGRTAVIASEAWRSRGTAGADVPLRRRAASRFAITDRPFSCEASDRAPGWRVQRLGNRAASPWNRSKRNRKWRASPRARRDRRRSRRWRLEMAPLGWSRPRPPQPSRSASGSRTPASSKPPDWRRPPAGRRSSSAIRQGGSARR